MRLGTQQDSFGRKYFAATRTLASSIERQPVTALAQLPTSSLFNKTNYFKGSKINQKLQKYSMASEMKHNRSTNWDILNNDDLM